MHAITNPDTFRKNIRIKLGAVLGEDPLSVNLEKGVYNYAIKEANNRKIIKKWENPYFAQLYIDRLRSIFLNLRNEQLLQQIKNKEITAQTLAFMTHQEMNPEHWKILIEQKIKRDANKFTTNIQASTDMFTCKDVNRNAVHITSYKHVVQMSPLLFSSPVWTGKNWKS